MDVLYFVLFLLAVVCFAAAFFGVDVRKMNLVALGLAFGFAVFMLQALNRL